jgi:hypothetical protein
MRALAFTAVTLLTAASVGCLPNDTRPEPAEIEFTASSSDATRSGFTTSDGYTIAFERVLIDVGQGYVGDGNDEGGSCSEYSSPGYTRLFDFVKVNSAQKVGLAYAIGSCPVAFSVRFPDPDAILGTGASEADRDVMRTPGSDAYANEAGISVYVTGTAERDGSVKRFDWPFRERILYHDCFVPNDDGTKSEGIVVEGKQTLSLNIEMQTEALFRDQLDPSVAVLRFQPFADADADADGNVTLDELDGTTLADLAPSYAYPFDPHASPDNTPLYCGDSDGHSITVKTLGDYAYCALAPSIARFRDTGACQIATGRRRRD